MKIRDLRWWIEGLFMTKTKKQLNMSWMYIEQLCSESVIQRNKITALEKRLTTLEKKCRRKS